MFKPSALCPIPFHVKWNKICLNHTNMFKPKDNLALVMHGIREKSRLCKGDNMLRQTIIIWRLSGVSDPAILPPTGQLWHFLWCTCVRTSQLHVYCETAKFQNSSSNIFWNHTASKVPNSFYWKSEEKSLWNSSVKKMKKINMPIKLQQESAEANGACWAG